MTTKKYYPKANSSPNFPQQEESILAKWQEQETFQKSVEQRDSANEFTFYDGPPFANGLPHYGHLLTGYIKDLVARFQTMKGKRVERRFGWDCHGLPAEMGAEKELGISGRHKIMEYGIEKFNDTCRNSVMKFSSEWEEYVTRQARWVDFKNDYKTMNTDYIESVLWAFKQLHEKGLVYESMRVMPYSWACETPLSNFETQMDNAYREKTSKAVTVAFELDKQPKGAPDGCDSYKLLAWTTTPWTLPSNMALAVGADIEYSCVVVDKTCYIIAKSSIPSYEKDLAVEEDQEFILIKGSTLENLTYNPLFPYFAEKKSEGAFRVLTADFVEEGGGTGIVHIAPGFGEDDFALCQKEKIPLVCPVDNGGKFTAEIFDLGEEFDSLTPHPNPPPQSGREYSELSSRGYKEQTLENAKNLRKNPTEPEKRLWSALKSKQLGVSFRKQHPIGKYIVDFICLDKKIIIEVDGHTHSTEEEKLNDDNRSEFLNDTGYKVLRFWNKDIIDNLEGVISTIQTKLKEENSSPLEGEVREGGKINPNIKTLSLQSRQVFETNDDIIKYLKQTNAWLKTEQYIHNYPHCWRTDTPLIYKAVPSWYVEVTKFKDRMVELNQEINWLPGHIRDGLFGKWLENARDWSISRNRFWGAPIPVWKSDNPKNKEIYVFGSIAELEEFFDTEVKDLHRPFIDTLTKPDPLDSNYTLRRVEDVFDCWFESGSMPYAQAHYPFDNKEWFEQHFPADFIVEYMAQTRGWFYTLMVLSTALFDRIPFKNVICHGVVLDGEGQKLSKRLNNYADPMELFKEYGSDALRFVMVSSPIMHGGDLLIDKEGKMVRDAVRLVMKPIWNAYHFFTLYANADEIKAEYNVKSENVMDQYILAKCSEAVTKIDKSLSDYDVPIACKAIEEFFEVLNNWYIRRNKERFWKQEKDQDKQTVYNTLYSVLHIMSRASAPLLPLLCEQIWQGLTDDEVSSVHLELFPNIDDIKPQSNLIMQMDCIRDACNAGLSVRGTENIRVRQPLSSLTLVANNAKDLASFSEIIKDELNVKSVILEENIEEFAEYKLKINFPVLGKRLPQKMKQIIPASKKGEWKLLANGKIEICDEELEKSECEFLLEPKEKQGTQALSTNDALVILDLNITEELHLEGIARDIVRLVQQSRKDADLHITDRISLKIESDNEDIKQAVVKFNDYIARQTLSKSINNDSQKNCEHNFVQKIEESSIKIGFNV